MVIELFNFELPYRITFIKSPLLSNKEISRSKNKTPSRLPGAINRGILLLKLETRFHIRSRSSVRDFSRISILDIEKILVKFSPVSNYNREAGSWPGLEKIHEKSRQTIGQKVRKHMAKRWKWSALI